MCFHGIIGFNTALHTIKDFIVHTNPQNYNPKKKLNPIDGSHLVIIFWIRYKFYNHQVNNYLPKEGKCLQIVKFLKALAPI